MREKIYIVGSVLILWAAWSAAHKEAKADAQKIYTSTQEALLLPDEVHTLQLSGQAPSHIPTELLACKGLRTFSKHGGAYTAAVFDSLWANNPNPELEKLIHSKLTELPDQLSQHWAELIRIETPNNRLSSFPNGFQRLEFIDLSGNKLRTLSDSFGYQCPLRGLNLSGNLLDSLPTGFGGWEGLETLQLAHNRLEHLPKGFRHMPALQTLNLSHNRLSELPDTLLYESPNLRSLELQHNQLRSLPLDALSRLKTQLKYLDLSDNLIPTQTQTEIRKCLPNTKIYF